MLQRFLSFAIAACLLLPGCGGPAGGSKPGGPPVEVLPSNAATDAEKQMVAEARAAFASMRTAVKAGKREEARQYVAKAKLQGAPEAELQEALNLLSEVEPTAARIDGAKVTLLMDTKRGELAISFAIPMIKEDGIWKLTGDEPDEKTPALPEPTKAPPPGLRLR